MLAGSKFSLSQAELCSRFVTWKRVISFKRLFYKIWCDGHALIYDAEFPPFLFYMSVRGLHIQVW